MGSLVFDIFIDCTTATASMLIEQMAIKCQKLHTTCADGWVRIYNLYLHTTKVCGSVNIYTA